ncbi:MAG: ArnT family glycosyltransferase [Candidatus Eiseniibacteriota bacterium]
MSDGMDLVRVAAALAVPTLAGWLLLDACFGARSLFGRLDRLSLAFGLGSGALTLTMLLLSFAGVHFDTRLLATILLLPAGIVFALRRGRSTPPDAPAAVAAVAPASLPLRVVLVASIVVSLATVFARTMLVEIDHWDAWAMWAYKAKIFFVHRIVPLDLFPEFEKTFGHWDYPQHVPLLETWILLFLGEWNDQPPRVLFPLFHAALCVNAFAFLRRTVAVEPALLGALLFATLSGLQRWVIGTMVEPVLVCYFVTSLGLLFRWMHEKDGRLLVLAGIFAGLCGWTKNDGFALFLSLAVTLGFYVVVEGRSRPRRAAAAFARFALPGALVVLPWSLFTRAAGLENDVVNASNVTWATVWGHLHRVGGLPGIFLHHFTDVGHWNVLWPLFLVVLVARAKTAIRSPLRYLLLPVAVLIAVDVALYVIWPHETEEYLYDTLQRLLLGPASIAVLFLVLATFRSYSPRPNHQFTPNRNLAAEPSSSIGTSI